MAFSKSRKTVKSSLEKNYPIIKEVLESLGIKPAARPHEITIAQWDSIYKLLESSVNSS